MENEEKKEEKPKNSLLDETKEAIEELKKEREEISKIRDELIQLRADQLLSGRSEAGSIPQEKTEEEIKKEGAKEFWKGSEIEKALERHG